MAQYVAFLRAVNVGGKRTVEMSRLRSELAALGYDDVSTFMNSGNAILSTGARRAGLERAIERRLAAAFGFDVPTFVRTASEVVDVASATPFGAVGTGHTHLVAFLRAALPAAARRAVEAMSNDVDTLVVDGRDVHWLIRGTSMSSTLRPRDWREAGADPTTTRNITMLRKLATKLER